MASIVLTTIASSIPTTLPALGGTILRTVGFQLGKQIGGRLFGKSSNRYGSRLADLSVQTSTYGDMIPVVYGTARIAGNILWSADIKESATTTSSGGKGGSGTKQTQTTYNYSVTMAIAICEGAIDEVLRVWADSKAIDPNDSAVSYTLYKGTETHLPDSVIEGFEGVGNVPAYRGIAYVVIEDFPLGDFGNRIPNFTFEVKKSLLNAYSTDESAEDLVKSMIMIPGSGEFVYDTTVQSKISGELVNSTWVQNGNKTRINQNNRHNKADSLVSLDQLEETFKNLEWVGVVVGWFGDNLDAGVCTIKPAVEYKTGAISDPDSWLVDTFTRSTARQISLDVNGNPVYGGTPSDAGLLRYLDELKTRGLKIMFYPMFFMDTANKPWRGRVTGSAADVATFFTKANGYNAFVNHYAALVKDKVDAFVIGSELIGLTKVQDVDNSFPAVDELVSLAASVKTTVGTVKVTYAADWSEYHHEINGWYNLDPLWASANIDMVGIDSYFPLTDEPQSGYDEQKVINGWTSGEGYDWYYTDPQRTTKANLDPKYAWKNIDWWWKNTHVNPDTNPTSWTPQSKKIWFTEYGFPSVDGSTNQPNVFYDPNSSESFFPRFSKGRVDFRAQRLGITATEKQWKNSTMVERMFLWTWDARPFPFWPDLLNVWSDGNLWKTGHWVQGKMGTSGLGAIVADLCRKSGLLDTDFDVTKLNDLVDGYVLTEQITARSGIEDLRKAYFFDAVESDGVIKFVPRGGAVAVQLVENDLTEKLSLSRKEELELPQKVDVTYISKTFDYLVNNQHSQRLVSNSLETYTVNLPIVMSNQLAKSIADSTLFQAWLERTGYKFGLSAEYSYLEPTDIVDVTNNGITHKIRITNTDYDNSILNITGIAEDISVYDFYAESGDTVPVAGAIVPVPTTKLEILDLPALPSDSGNDGIVRFAAAGVEAGWNGAIIYRSDDGGVSYNRNIDIGQASIIGTASTILGDGTYNVFDETNTVTVILINGTLESVTENQVLNGANTAQLGNEIIQFKTATLISSGKYTLSGLLRGRAGTENETGNHVANETFVLLDNTIIKTNTSLIGLSRKYKPVSVGHTLGQTVAQDFTYQGKRFKPFSPVHITGTRDGSSNLTISWIRRSRINGGWRDNVDVPLGEESESYEVDIMNGSNVVRTITASTPPTTYSATDQITDFGSTQTSIAVKIYQISAVVGRGSEGVGNV